MYHSSAGGKLLGLSMIEDRPRNAGGRIARMRHKGGIHTDNKRIAWLVLAVLAGSTLLAIGLRQIEFAPALRYTSQEPTTAEPSLTRLAEEIARIPLGEMVALWALVLGILALVVSALSPELRKRLLRSLIRFLAFLFIVTFAIQRNPGLLSLLEPPTPLGAEGTEAADANLAPPPVFEPPQLSAVTVYLISLAAMMILIAGAWWFSRGWSRRQTLSAQPPRLDEFGAIARSTLDDMAGGRDWGNAIIRCYDQMSRMVDRRRGLARAESMTPAEFALRLQVAGLPSEPVTRLTRLFERARYGLRSPKNADIEEAAGCLKEIAAFCGEAA